MKENSEFKPIKPTDINFRIATLQLSAFSICLYQPLVSHDRYVSHCEKHLWHTKFVDLNSKIFRYYSLTGELETFVNIAQW